MIRTCHNCRKTAQIGDMAQILERKAGQLTGRSFLLCPECRVQFFKGEISMSDTTEEQKYNLLKWNKKESEIWTPN